MRYVIAILLSLIGFVEAANEPILSPLRVDAPLFEKKVKLPQKNFLFVYGLMELAFPGAGIAYRRMEPVVEFAGVGFEANAALFAFTYDTLALKTSASLLIHYSNSPDITTYGGVGVGLGMTRLYSIEGPIYFPVFIGVQSGHFTIDIGGDFPYTLLPIPSLRAGYTF